MATQWEANELERRTAARLAAIGFVPALNVKDADTQTEFDVYAFCAEPTGLTRLMVQCSHPAPKSEKLTALRGYAAGFGADICVYVTHGKPHDDQALLSQRLGVALLSESLNSNLAEASLAGRQLHVQQPLSVREDTIVSFSRCLARLRRIAYDSRDAQPDAEAVVRTWVAIDGVPHITDPFQRIARLYEIHFQTPRLSERCAVSEGLADNAREALQAAYAYGRGTYTQSALAVQTVNRIYTLLSLCECSCLVADGSHIPEELDDPQGRRGDIIRSLSTKPYRHLLGIFAFELLYGWGGFWHLINERPFKNSIAADIGCQPEEIDSMVGFLDSLFRTQGMGQFVKQVSTGGAQWRSMLLLPYFAKGVGIRRIEAEIGLQFPDAPWADWRDEAIRLESDCETYERGR